MSKMILFCIICVLLASQTPAKSRISSTPVTDTLQPAPAKLPSNNLQDQNSEWSNGRNLSKKLLEIADAMVGCNRPAAKKSKSNIISLLYISF